MFMHDHKYFTPTLIQETKINFSCNNKINKQKLSSRLSMNQINRNIYTQKKKKLTVTSNLVSLHFDAYYENNFI